MKTSAIHGYPENYELFNLTEFDNWAGKGVLTAEEDYLFGKFIYALDKNASILDLGTGSGRFLLELAKRDFTRLHGIDLAERLLLAARRRTEPFPFIKFYRMSAAELKFDSGTFDAVLGLQQVISFIEDDRDRAAAFHECSRVLKPHGLFAGSFLMYGGRWINPAASLL
ncbi:MAG: class I SAM-dependent methyltransferase, partial [Nitrospiraceae bacterium]|nr:class I SAM-dependent methyltransferase [Nitrospiraceae bacterium]